MDNLEPLRAQLRTTLEPTRMTVTIELPSSMPAGQALDLIAGYFGAEDNREAVQLRIDDEEAGYLLRSDLYASSALTYKGIGDSDHGVLPGLPRYQLIRLHCTRPACQERLYVTRIDPSQPRYCKLHPAVAMEIDP